MAKTLSKQETSISRTDAIKIEIENYVARIEALQTTRATVQSDVSQLDLTASPGEIALKAKQNSVKTLAAANQLRALDEAIAYSQAQIQSLNQELAIIDQQSRVEDGLAKLKAASAEANQKLTEAMQAVLEVKAIANSLGRDVISVYGRSAFESRWDITAGFPHLEIYDRRVILNSQLFPLR